MITENEVKLAGERLGLNPEFLEFRRAKDFNLNGHKFFLVLYDVGNAYIHAYQFVVHLNDILHGADEEELVQENVNLALAKLVKAVHKGAGGTDG